MKIKNKFNLNLDTKDKTVMKWLMIMRNNDELII